MATPITWSTVAAPDLTGELAAISKANQGVSDAFTNTVTEFTDLRKKQDSDALIAKLRSAGSAEERQGLVDEANKASSLFGLNNEQIYTAQGEATARDTAAAAALRDEARFGLEKEAAKNKILKDAQDYGLRSEAAGLAQDVAEADIEYKGAQIELKQDEAKRLKTADILKEKLRLERLPLTDAERKDKLAGFVERNRVRQVQKGARDASLVQRKALVNRAVPRQGENQYTADVNRLAAFREESVNKEFTPAQNKALASEETKLLNQYSKSTDTAAALRAIAKVGDLNDIPKDGYTDQLKIDLTNTIVADLKEQFPWMGEDQLKLTAVKTMAQNATIGTGFALGKELKDLRLQQQAQRIVLAEEKEVKDKDLLLAMGDQPVDFLSKVIQKNDKENYISPVLAVETADHLKDTIYQTLNVDGGNGLPSMGPEGKAAVKLALHSLMQTVRGDKDNISNDAVLPTVDGEAHVTGLTTNQIMQAFLEGLPDNRLSAKKADGTDNKPANMFEQRVREYIKNRIPDTEPSFGEVLFPESRYISTLTGNS